MKSLALIGLCIISFGAFAQTKSISYELHKRTNHGEMMDWYTAIIRPINPAKDDYKAYCRYIVKDIAKKAGTNKMVVEIVDNRKAYELYEIKHLQNGNILNRNDMGFVEKHTVGAYQGGLPGEPDTYELVFYEDAGLKQYKGRETFKP